MRKRGQAECHQPDPKSRASTDICVQVLDLGIGSQRFRMREKGVKQGSSLYMVTAKTRSMNKVWPDKLIPLETTWVSQTRKATGSGDNREC